MPEHQFDFIKRTFTSPRGRLRMMRHKQRPKKVYPRYTNSDMSMRSELGWFKKDSLVPQPKTADEQVNERLLVIDRLAEIAECELAMLDNIAHFREEINEMAISDDEVLQAICEYQQRVFSANDDARLLLNRITALLKSSV